MQYNIRTLNFLCEIKSHKIMAKKKERKSEICCKLLVPIFREVGEIKVKKSNDLVLGRRPSTNLLQTTRAKFPYGVSILHQKNVTKTKFIYLFPSL